MLIKKYKRKGIINSLIGCLVVILIMNIFSVQASADVVVEEIKNILNNYYIDNVPGYVLSSDSVNEIIKDLDDPYTQIMDQNDYDSIVNSTFSGIGVTIEMMKIGAEVTSVMINSPAMYVGLRIGDIITFVDEKSLKGVSGIDVLNLLNGKEGVPSQLKIERKNKLVITNVTPGKVYYPTVYSKVIDNKTGYLRISSFGLNTLDEFRNKISSLEMSTVDSYIIDLRNNPGGYIYSAVELAGYFSKNDSVAIFQTKDGEKFKFKATENKRIIDKQTVFLVNKYTASAAELLAVCAQDYGTATIIGETTYGKGVAQSTFSLSDGSILKTTTLKLYSPKGRDISKVGISPDIHIKDADSLHAGELLTGSGSKPGAYSSIVRAVISNKDYYINMNRIGDREHLDAYKQIIGQATSTDILSYSSLNQNGNMAAHSYPVLKYIETPKLEYKVGDRVSFKLNTPNYNGLVQYRAMLWDEASNQFIDMWKTKDRYYDKWIPRGKDVFTISFPATTPGSYKIKVFVKRSGIQNSAAALKGMNCDSYIYEIPFNVGS